MKKCDIFQYELFIYMKEKIYSEAKVEKIKDEKVEEIINMYFKLLFKIAYNYTLDAFKAEDIVQEVFLKFYRARNTFNDDEHIKIG